ncbi:MAG: hypothetical protein ABI614_12745, partial [Planctomycetota bacterium]
MQLLLIISAICGSATLLAVLARWAMHGDGYWPRGPLGALLAVIFMLGVLYVVPAFVIALRQLTPVLWIVPPLHNSLP